MFRAPRPQHEPHRPAEEFTCDPTRKSALHRAYPHDRGREGVSRSSDGRLDIQLSSPGGPGSGTNPEQLFAAGWSACFIGALRLAATRMKVQLPPSLAVDAEVDLGTTDGAYGLVARLKVSLPGIDEDIAQQLVSAAHETCPYSKATRGNIAVYIAGRLITLPIGTGALVSWLSCSSSTAMLRFVKIWRR